jgi:hypothetical protein
MQENPIHPLPSQGAEVERVREAIFGLLDLLAAAVVERLRRSADDQPPARPRGQPRGKKPRCGGR